MVQVHARASNLFDLVAMRTVGSGMQRSNWERVVERMVKLSGGDAPDGLRTETTKLDDEEAAVVEADIKEMVTRRKRESAESGKRPPERAASETGRKQAIPDTVGGAIEGVMATANTAAEALARAATKIADKINEKKR
jgi:hypothetical protein